MSDGKRISVMSRHTLSDGTTPDPDITTACFDEWLPILGPPPNLIGSYYKRNLPWDAFEKLYLEYIQTPDVDLRVRELASLALNTNITLLCVEETPEHCHRRLLAERITQLHPDLGILVK